MVDTLLKFIFKFLYKLHNKEGGLNAFKYYIASQFLITIKDALHPGFLLNSK